MHFSAFLPVLVGLVDLVHMSDHPLMGVGGGIAPLVLALDDLIRVSAEDMPLQLLLLPVQRNQIMIN